MENEDLQDLIEFAQKRPWIEAIYQGKTPQGESTVYFYIPGYRWSKDKESQAEIKELDQSLGLNLGMMAIWRSPEEAKKQEKLEKIIYQKEKNQ